MTKLTTQNEFIARHIGPRDADTAAMLELLGYASIDALTDNVIPESIKGTSILGAQPGLSEADALAKIKTIAAKNQQFKTYIGQGYYGTHTPSPILRNLLENPAWYTAYTPYQPEISQGRLEALLNFQTMVAELTGLDIANASMLDEGTAAAEAMTLAPQGDKTRILSATIYLADIGTFAQMNSVWDTWVPQGHTPARATVEARLATSVYLVEIQIIAART
jgi:glycine dehydrogenase